MTAAANSRDRMRAVLVIVATIGTIWFNFLAATGSVNGVTPDVISDKYPNILTPAGYAFSIWSLIYLGIVAFSIYQFLGANLVRFRAIRSLYIFSCLLNCGWIYFWHRDQIAICLVFIFALLATLFLMLILFRRSEASGGTLFTKVPFGIYAGWVTAASLVNFVIFLKYEGVELSNFAWNLLGAVLIIFAALIAILVRAKLKNYVYPIAVAWALTAIAVKQGGNTSILVAAAIGVVSCLVTAGSVVVDLKDSSSE
ncbi:MAG: tryptophan-rich sensory protein [Chloracidobacterium sp.]|nr:tryptophan-rich sensory protein [Chloracidobacterium sp.]